MIVFFNLSLVIPANFLQSSLSSLSIETLEKLNLKAIADTKDRDTEIVDGRVGVGCIMVIHGVWRSGEDDA